MTHQHPQEDPNMVHCLFDDFNRRLDAGHELARFGEHPDFDVVGSLGHLQAASHISTLIPYVKYSTLQTIPVQKA